MNTAIKAHAPDRPATFVKMNTGNGNQCISDPVKIKKTRNGPEGKNARRIRLIFEQSADQWDVFVLFGWQDLPVKLKKVIQSDMEVYRNELLGLYSTCDQGVRERRKSVSFWIKAYRDGICNEKVALKMLIDSV